MLSQSDLERERYEARKKAELDQLDYEHDLAEARSIARQEGHKEGRIEGKIGVIHLCERLLKQPMTSGEQLAKLPLDELTRMADKLQALVQAPK